MRCAQFHEMQHADPIGAAPAYDAFLVVDVPLPWDAEVTGQEPIRSIVDGPATTFNAGDGTRWRALARVPRRPSADGDDRRRVTAHVATRQGADGWVARGPFRTTEWLVDAGGVAALGRHLLRGDPLPSTAEVDRTQAGPSATSLLVCSHGRRDQCCGSFGTALVEHLDDLRDASGSAVDLQRISHTGGHRFAPTAITFPDGYAWAHLDPVVADLLVRRAVPAERFARHCRGSTLFDGSAAQVADRAGLIEFGWAWADATRSIEVVAFDRSTMATVLRATGRLPDGSRRAVEVEVVPDRQIPMPTCGLVDGPEYRTETVWRTEAVRRVEAGGQ